MHGPSAAAGPLLAGLLVCAAPAAAEPVSEADLHENLPPLGRSLFDEIVRVQDGDRARLVVPYPLPKLLALIRQRGGIPDTGVRRVLIPLGRSLQRNGASPEFFRFPRTVVAVDGEPGRSGRELALKDRLFIGHQERVQIVEVISYNEAAARFEFQLVKDYGPGLTPRVVYTRRSTCTLCHQGEGPIFSRTPWDETNANPIVAALLRRERDSFDGAPPAASLDEANAFDDATDRANLLSTHQRVWRDACGATSDAVACRALLWRALLQLRLSGSRPPAQASAADAPLPWRELAREWRSAWAAAFPEGLAIPDPNLPNRDPLRGPRPSSGRPALLDDFGGAPTLDHDALLGAAAVDPLFEPFLRRAPLEVWDAEDLDEARVEQILLGMAGWIPRAELGELDRTLFARGDARPGGAPTYTAPCRIERRERPREEALLRLRCAAPDGSALEGSLGERSLRGTLEHLQLPGRGRLWNLTIAARSRRLGPHALRLALDEPGSGLHARLADGNAIAGIDLTWRPGEPSGDTPNGDASIRVLDDFAAVDTALARLRARADRGELPVLGSTPFRPGRLMAVLLEELGLQLPSEDPAEAELPAPEFADP